MRDVIIIGAGAVGVLIARELKKYQLDVLLIEKHNDVGFETSSANSAIIHSGYDPVPGTLKAILNVEGNKMFDELSKDLDFKFFRMGSLTIALNIEELKILDELKKRSNQNGVEVKILNKEETLKIEPKLNNNVLGSLFAPTAGIVDPFNMVANAAENFVDNNGELKLSEEVIDIKYIKDHFKVITNKNEYECKYLINSAGLFSTQIAKIVDPTFPYNIVPNKGEYYLLEKNFELVRHTIFNVPTSKGKGVLITNTTSNNYLIGPNNVRAESLDSTSTDVESLNDIKEKALRNLNFNPINKTIRVFAGNRSHLDNYHDFYIKNDKKHVNMLNLCGIESPGLTASPAIAKYVVDNFVSKYFDLKKNENFNPCIKKHVNLSRMSLEERSKFIKENPEYGEIVCYCEQVSLGQINDILNRSIPITSIKALRKRTRASFGKCQGGFCQSNLLKILKEHNKCDYIDVLYGDEDSNILESRAK